MPEAGVEKCLCGGDYQIANCQSIARSTCTTVGFWKATGVQCRSGNRLPEALRGRFMRFRRTGYFQRRFSGGSRRQSLHLYCCFLPLKAFLTTFVGPQKKHFFTISVIIFIQTWISSYQMSTPPVSCCSGDDGRRYAGEADGGWGIVCLARISLAVLQR